MHRCVRLSVAGCVHHKHVYIVKITHFTSHEGFEVVFSTFSSDSVQEGGELHFSHCRSERIHGKNGFSVWKKRWEFAGLFLWWVVLCVKSCRTFAFFGFGFALMFKLEILGHWSKGQGKFVLAGDHRGATYQLTSSVLKPPKLAQLMQLKQLPIYQ